MVLTDQKSQSTPQNDDGLNPSSRTNLKKWTKEDLEDLILKQEIVIARMKMEEEKIKEELLMKRLKFRNEKIMMAITFILLSIIMLIFFIMVK